MCNGSCTDDICSSCHLRTTACPDWKPSVPRSTLTRSPRPIVIARCRDRRVRVGAMSRRVRVLAWRAFERPATILLQRLLEPRERVRTHGLRIFDTLYEPVADELLTKVVAALDLISVADPRRLRRLRYDLDAIALIEWSLSRTIAAHMPGSRTCYLKLSALRLYSAPEVAIIIAHEGTHARLDRLHILSCSKALKYRVEHRCLREELAMARRFPFGQYRDVDAWVAQRAAESRYAASPTRRSARPVHAT
jgi:hypothetical protein